MKLNKDIIKIIIESIGKRIWDAKNKILYFSILIIMLLYKLFLCQIEQRERK
jgi:hypothetical protein